jgi:hypothetical protein
VKRKLNISGAASEAGKIVWSRGEMDEREIVGPSSDPGAWYVYRTGVRPHMHTVIDAYPIYYR